MGFPEAQKLRIILSNLIEKPYWNDDSRTEAQAAYECESIGIFRGDNLNCFSEVLERDRIILSFEHISYKKEKIPVSKNGKKYELYNLYDEESAAKNLFILNQFGFVGFLQQSFHKYNIVFYSNGSKYPADKYYESGDLSKEEVLCIKDDFSKFLSGRVNRSVLSRFVDSINYKGLTYNEFRTSLSDNRESSMYYYVDVKDLFFFDTLIKKTETTPECVKKKTYALINRYRIEKNSLD